MKFLTSLVKTLQNWSMDGGPGLRKVVTNIPRTSPCNEGDDAPFLKPKVDYVHKVLNIEEDIVNRILRTKVRKHWLFYSVTFEFEPNNIVFLGIITKFGNVINLNMYLEDVWFDDYSYSFEVKLDIGSIDTGGFIMNTLVHLSGGWICSLLGIFFNPFNLGNDGSTMRFEKGGKIRFNLKPGNGIQDFLPIPEREPNSKGPVLLMNPKTSQSVLHLDYYALEQEADRFEMTSEVLKTNWVRSIDMAAALLLPIGVWISFVILHHYLPTETLEFSSMTYFLISLGVLIISFVVMNIPRYLYMYFDTRKHWQSVFVHNNIKIQMRKLHRRIVITQSQLGQNGDCSDPTVQKRITQLLLQIRDKRFLAQRLKIADEDRDRKQKVKFIIAYIGCTLLEWMLLMH